MKIDIIVNDGSPVGVVPEDIYGSAGRIGIGGAELALLTMCEQWSQEGFSVCLYNSPRIHSNISNFEQRPLEAFAKKQDRDILIIFRSPNPRSYGAHGKKVWWSCDQKTIGNFSQFSKEVDQIVVISPFHRKYFESTYGIRNALSIDLPVRLQDYPEIDDSNRKCDRILFSSIPDRGLQYLHAALGLIRAHVRELELVITSDYQLWGSHAGNEMHRMRFVRNPGVVFKGAIPRQELIEYQQNSWALTYPCSYEELFCISCAEALVAGCMPITSDCGALESTNMYKIISGLPTHSGWIGEFVNAIVQEIQNPDLERRKEVRRAARERFDPQRISNLWKEQVFK